jgi:hypothetical protein
LTLSLSNSAAFTLSATSINSLAAGGTAPFKVTPKTGLSAGTYSATVTVSGGTNITAKNFSVSFTVNPPAPVYGISLNPGTWTFPAADPGYGAQTAKSVTISNTGTHPTGNLTLALSSSSAFTLSTTAINSIGVNGSNSFTVTPKTGRAAGTYSATVTVSGGNITSKNFSVSFTVNPPLGFNSLASALAYLDSQATGGINATNPVPLKLNINLSSATEGWVALGNALASRNKYVALDLSDSGVNNEEFDFGVNGDGAAKIVSLVLPDSATSMVGGGTGMRAYASLKTVSGANISTIGGNTFYWCSSLTSVSFPEVTSLEIRAFYGCTSLTSVSFPKVTSIDTYAFQDCTALWSASFAEAPGIGTHAFDGCTSLTEVAFPEVTSIGEYAFYRCTSLTTVSIPKVTSIAPAVFTRSGTTPLTITMGAVAPTVGASIFGDVTGTKNVTIRVLNGATDYTNDWKDAFKGKGNSNTALVNKYINLVIQYY